MEAVESIRVVIEVPRSPAGAIQPVVGLSTEVKEREFVLTVAWLSDLDAELAGWHRSRMLERHFHYLPGAEAHRVWRAPEVARGVDRAQDDSQVDFLELAIHRWAGERDPRAVISWTGILRPAGTQEYQVLTLGKEKHEA